jgi:hypothetical protein
MLAIRMCLVKLVRIMIRFHDHFVNQLMAAFPVCFLTLLAAISLEHAWTTRIKCIVSGGKAYKARRTIA